MAGIPLSSQEGNVPNKRERDSERWVSMLKLQELTPQPSEPELEADGMAKSITESMAFKKQANTFTTTLRSNFRRQCEARLLQHARNAIECIRMQSIFGWIWKWMSGSSTGWHDEMNHTYSKQPDWAGYQKKPTDQKQILKKTVQQQWINKKKIKWITAEAGCIQQPRVGTNPTLRSVFVLQRSDYCMWQKPIHSLLALVSLHPSQGVRTSPPLYRGTCTWKILLMDKALHQFDMANELKHIQITSNYDVWFHPKTGLFCRCCRVSSHPTCHPDPTADEPVPSISYTVLA